MALRKMKRLAHWWLGNIFLIGVDRVGEMILCVLGEHCGGVERFIYNMIIPTSSFIIIQHHFYLWQGVHANNLMLTMSCHFFLRGLPASFISNCP